MTWQQKNKVTLQPYKTSRGSVSQSSMNSITGGQSTAQTFTTMRPTVLDCPQIPDEEYHAILWEEVEAAIKADEDGNVSWSGWRTSRLSSSRRRSLDRHHDLNLQQDLEDRRMAVNMDSIPSYHTPKERQLAAVPELQNHQHYQPS